MKNFTRNLIQVSMIASFVFAVALLLSPRSTFAATPACGSTITTNTTLDSDMSCSGTAINIIGANNITFDCAGHTITRGGAYSSYYTGIFQSGGTGVTIKNCAVSGFAKGIHLLGSHYNTLTSNTTNSNGEGGIILYSSRNNILTSNTANSNNDAGIRLNADSNNNTLTSNTANSNGNFGIALFSSSNNTLTNNIVLWNGNDIFVNSSSLNSVLIGNTVGSDIDSDRDGVCNPGKSSAFCIGSDQCPSTVAGSTVDSNGCSQAQLDADHDGIEDSADMCFASVPDTDVGENRFSWLGGSNFMTKDPKTKQLVNSDYTMNQTRGCTCNQILAGTAGQEKGQVQSGCTKETLETFIENNTLAHSASLWARFTSALSNLASAFFSFFSR